MTDYERYFKAYESLAPAHADAGPPPVVVLVAGAPGAGKSTLAEALARSLRATVASMDWQLGALTPFRVLTNENAAPLAEMMVIAAAARQLQLGLDAVIDVTGHEVEARRRYRAVAAALGARFVGVECVCSDEALHRARVEGRDRGIPGWKATVAWEHVLRMKSRWEPWDEPHLILDSAAQDIDTSVKRALGEITAARAGAGS